MIETVLFYLFALLILAGGVLTVTARNIFHSALFLAATLLGVAAVYVLLQATFLAAVQILIYVGAVVVLTIFVINLTRGITGKSGTQVNRAVVPAVLVSLLTVTLIIAAVLKSGVPSGALVGTGEDNTALIGNLLLRDYVIPFEVISVLLLAALIGAIAVVNKDREAEVK